jgi:hypothetical protein
MKRYENVHYKAQYLNGWHIFENHACIETTIIFTKFHRLYDDRFKENELSTQTTNMLGAVPSEGHGFSTA